MTTTWTIAVDWDRDGDFTNADNNVTSYVISANWFLGMRKSFQDVADNSLLTLVLNNADRRFSPEANQLRSGAANPLAGKVRPFKPVRITSHDGTTERVHWHGWVDAIQPAVNQYGERTVTILASGPLQFYHAAEAELPLQENKRTDEIIAELLKRVVIPPVLAHAWILGRQGNSNLGISTYLADTTAYSTLDVGSQTLHMAADNWVKDGGMSNAPKDTYDVYQAIQEVVAAERGRFFFDREGKAIFWNRQHLFVDDPANPPLFDNSMQEMSYTYAGVEDIKNEVIVICHPRTISPTDDVSLWELGNSIIRVPARKDGKDGEKSFYIKYEDDSKNRIGAKDVHVDAADLEFETGTAAVTLDPQANGAELKVTNSGTSEAIITKLIVRGRKITDEGEIEAKSTDTGSMTDYGRRVLRINLPSVDDLDKAQAIADFERDRRKSPRGDVKSITLKSHGKNGGVHHADQLSSEVGHVVAIKEAQTQHEKDYVLIGEAHELTQGATLWKTTWYFEPTPEVYPWKLGVAGRSELAARRAWRSKPAR